MKCFYRSWIIHITFSLLQKMDQSRNTNEHNRCSTWFILCTQSGEVISRHSCRNQRCPYHDTQTTQVSKLYQMQYIIYPSFVPNLGRSYYIIAVATKDVCILTLKPLRYLNRYNQYIIHSILLIWGGYITQWLLTGLELVKEGHWGNTASLPFAWVSLDLKAFFIVLLY